RGPRRARGARGARGPQGGGGRGGADRARADEGVGDARGEEVRAAGREIRSEPAPGHVGGPGPVPARRHRRPGGAARLPDRRARAAARAGGRGQGRTESGTGAAGERQRRRMRRSTERFLTTHTGSLPRPDDLIRTMYAKEEGAPVDRAALAARVRTAVAEVVKKQGDAGIDLVNDGEMSKPSYATYVKDRLAGFGGSGNTFVYQDLADFPNLAKRVFGDPGRSRRKTPACNAPIAVRDRDAAKTDVDNLTAALSTVGRADAFMSAA